MKTRPVPFLAAAALTVLAALAAPVPASAADDSKPGDKSTGDSKEEKKEEKKGYADRDAEKLKKETDAITKRLNDDSKKKLWDIVTKGTDDQLAEIKLTPERLESLKAARPNLKGWTDILATESLGKETLKDLVAYGASSKFAKAVADEKDAKAKAEKDRERDKRKERRERDRERKEKD